MTALLLGAVLAVVSAGGGAPFERPTDARVVAIVTASPPRPVTLEWRRIEHGATVPLGELQVTLGARTETPAGPDERVLRVLEPGASPRSFLVPAGTAPVSFDLGPPVKGGEVFGRLAPRRYRPEAIRFVGASGRADARPDDNGVFAASGLVAGRHEVEPVYRGGVVGRKVAVSVQNGRTSELLPLDLPETGAARFELASSLCGEPELELRLEAPGLRAHRAAMPPGACVLEVEGLDPATWSANVTRGAGRNEPRAQAEFEVTAGEAVDVALEAVVRGPGP